MLSGRLILACGLAASLGVAFVRAEDRNGADKGDVGLASPAASTTVGGVDAPYPHIYQAPLFGSDVERLMIHSFPSLSSAMRHGACTWNVC